MTKGRVAIFGGSFDPPHVGHVLSVAWALSATPVDTILVVPTWKHAFDKAHGASFEDRFAMCAHAFMPFRGVRVSNVEKKLGGVSLTLRTIEALAEEHPDASFRLLIGADVLSSTDRWHRWDDVVRAAPPLVVGREGYDTAAGSPIAIPDVNSTELRQRIAADQDVAGYVPTAVFEHIRTHGLYRGAA